MSRPLLVGLHNPLSSEPEFALYPLPPGCTGARILEMLGPAVTRLGYLEAFDRVNLLEHDERVGGKGYADRLRHARIRLIDHVAAGKYETLVLFGADVWRAVYRGARLARPPWLCWDSFTFSRGGLGWRVRFLTLPHPSGRNQWYNVPGNREAVTRKLRQLAVIGSAETNETNL